MLIRIWHPMCLFCFTIILSTCAPNLVQIELTEDEQIQYDKNWEIAAEIVRYDRFAWIATDSLMIYQEEVDLDDNVKGYVVLDDKEGARAVFGKLENGIALKAFEVFFRPGYARCKMYRPQIPASVDVSRRFQAMDMAREINNEFISQFHVPYCSYVFGHGDSLVVYFSPGSTDDFIVFFGATRTAIDTAGMRIRNNINLHKTALILKPNPTAPGMYRALLSDIPNEVDIAQSIILAPRTRRQYIVTPKYNFVVTYNPKTQETPCLIYAKQ